MAHCPNKNLEEWKLLVASRGEDIAYYLWDKYEGKVPESESNQSIVKAGLKSIQILNSDKAKQVFDKGQKNNWTLDKILSELSIPKEQKSILLDLGITNREELITSLLSSYSYSIEINTAKAKEGNERLTDLDVRMAELGIDAELERALYYEQREATRREIATQHYSDLTVPGGTNYTENEISTPLITPSIKGHAQFSTENGIGWFRSDDKTQDNTFTIPESDKNVISRVDDNLRTSTKTRRILEVQSDYFQKIRNNFNFEGYHYFSQKDARDSSKIQYSRYKAGQEIEYISKQEYEKTFDKYKDTPLLDLLRADNNWVTFFVKSIIQSTAKQTITEVQESDVEAKVKELENSGLLKIKCD